MMENEKVAATETPTSKSALISLNAQKKVSNH